MIKPVKTKAFKDRLKGHKDVIVEIFSPNGPKGGLLWTGSKEGSLRRNSPFNLRNNNKKRMGFG